MRAKEHKIKDRLIHQYFEAFKRQVCEEYLQTGQTKRSLLNKYGIRMKSGLQTWLRQLGYVDIHQKVASSPFTTFHLALEKTPASTSEPDQQPLEKRIKELEYLLLEEQLRSQAYHRMIELAEQELKLPIRKRFSTK